MTSKQKSLYWREWAKVRKVLIGIGEYSPADADAERHEIHRRALGTDKSSKDINNRDLDAILDHFEAYTALADGHGAGPSRAEIQPAHRLVWAIDHLGLPPAYIESIARDQFHTSDWRSLPVESLTKLRFTLATRARRRAHAS